MSPRIHFKALVAVSKSHLITEDGRFTNLWVGLNSLQIPMSAEGCPNPKFIKYTRDLKVHFLPAWGADSPTSAHKIPTLRSDMNVKLIITIIIRLFAHFYLFSI